MNSKDYYIEVSLFFSPFDEETCGMVEAELSELPYDSFMLDDGPVPCLKAYILKEAYDARALKLVLGGLPFDVSFTSTLVEPRNWNATWENAFTPIVVDSRVVVKSLTHTEEDVRAAKMLAGEGLSRSRFNIRIDPQMAFGTGHHMTTYMMIESMLDIEDRIKGGSVLDMGCGTGVLAILAAKMGAAKTFAVDIDAVASESTFWNSFSNRVAKRIEVACGDASLLQAGSYDVILANIHRNILIQDMSTYIRSLRHGGLLLLSGFYDADISDILAAAAPLEPVSRRSRDGWSCLTLKKQ